LSLKSATVPISDMKPIRDFFWFCSGATRSVLKRSPIDSEKYAGIGATVFFTGLFASLSAGYALFTVFNNLLIASIAGLLWGLMIFNLDRYIVSSMVKRDRFWPEFKLLLPRLALAILLALVISKPLELKIFEREINRQLDIKKSEEIISTRESIRKGLPEMEQLENRISLLKLPRRHHSVTKSNRNTILKDSEPKRREQPE
jgi:hypothetical protein